MVGVTISATVSAAEKAALEQQRRPRVLMNQTRLLQSTNRLEYVSTDDDINGEEHNNDYGDINVESSVSSDDDDEDESETDEEDGDDEEEDGNGSDIGSDEESDYDVVEEGRHRSLRAIEEFAANIETLCRDAQCERIVAASSLLVSDEDLRRATVNVIRVLQEESDARMPTTEAMTLRMEELTQRVIDDLSMVLSAALTADDIASEFRLHRGNLAMLLAARGEFTGMAPMWISFVCRNMAQYVATLRQEVLDLRHEDPIERVRRSMPDVPDILVVAASILCNEDIEKMESDLHHLMNGDFDSDSSDEDSEPLVQFGDSISEEDVDGASVAVIADIFCESISNEEAYAALARVGGDIMAAFSVLNLLDGLSRAAQEYVKAAVQLVLDDYDADSTSDSDLSSASTTESDEDSGDGSDNEDSVNEGSDNEESEEEEESNHEYEEVDASEEDDGGESSSEETTALIVDEEDVQFVQEHVPWVNRERVLETLVRFEGACDETIVELMGSRPRTEA